MTTRPAQAEAAHEAPSQPAGAPTTRLRAAILSGSLVVLLAATWLLSGALVSSTAPVAVAAGRSSVSFAGLALLAAARTATRRPALDAVKRRPGAAAVLGLLGVFGYSAASIAAISLTGAATTNAVLALLPCITFVLGVALFGQRLHRTAALGTCLAVTAAMAYAFLDRGDGLGARVHSSAAHTAVGVGCALAAAICMALYAHYYAGLTAGASSVVSLPGVFGAGAAMLLVPALVSGSFSGLSLEQWTGIAVLGGVIYVPAYVVQHELLLRKGPLFTTSVSLVVPFVVRLSTWAWGVDDAPGPATLALLVVCLIGVRVTLRRPPGPAD